VADAVEQVFAPTAESVLFAVRLGQQFLDELAATPQRMAFDVDLQIVDQRER
jgi:hypothetical protein